LSVGWQVVLPAAAKRSRAGGQTDVAMSTPDALPLLGPGAHLTPTDGACLMELVSVLAGQPWSDHPACTDPTLATIARVVNDELSDPARQTLAQLAAELVGRTGDPAWVAPALVHRCLPMAEAHLGSPARRLRRHQRRALRRLTATGRRRPACPAWLYAWGPAQHAITGMVLALRRLPADRRDDALRAVLDAAVSVVPQRAPAAPAPDPAAAAGVWSTTTTRRELR
jgi:hypothetical protein